MLEWTKTLSDRFDAEVLGIHVIGSAVLGHVLSMSQVTEGKSLAQPEIDRVFSDERDTWRRQLIDAGVVSDRIRTETAFGNVAEEILACAEREQADFIIMGSHASTLCRALLGSSASAVLRETEVPVLIVVAPKDE